MIEPYYRRMLRVKEKMMVKLIDKNGKEVDYEILNAFQLSKTGKKYIVYTDNKNDEQGKLNVFSSIYYPDDDFRLDPIEIKEEWEAVESDLAALNQ